jgi:hypothetical protein
MEVGEKWGEIKTCIFLEFVYWIMEIIEFW